MKKINLKILVIILIIIIFSIICLSIYISKPEQINDVIDENTKVETEDENVDEIFTREKALELIASEAKKFADLGIEQYKELDYLLDKEDENYYYFIAEDNNGIEYEAVVSKEKKTVTFSLKNKLRHT